MSVSMLVDTFSASVLDMARDVAELLRLYLQGEQRRGRLVSAQLARELGITPAAVDHYISGRNKVPLDRLDTIAQFLDFPTAEAMLAKARAQYGDPPSAKSA